jgi:hypothetical protein
MAGRIFINYRRGDSPGTAGRLQERLGQAFGRDNVFMDVEHIPAGVDFRDYLNRQVAACDVFLAIVGPNWLDAKDDSGGRRLDNPDDFAAVEIAAALARDIRVIPVLVDGARMPKTDELPGPLRPFAGRNAVDVRNAQFGRDAEALVEKIRDALKGERTARGWWPAVALGAAALLLAAWLGLYQMGIPAWRTAGTVQPDAHRADEAAADADAAARRRTEKVQTTPPGAGAVIPMAGALDPVRWSRRAGTGGHQFVAGELTIYTHQGSVLMAASDTSIRRDFTYSIRTELVSGPTQLGFGLVFGMEDADNYFLFAKASAGSYRLTQRRGGQEQVILPWTSSDAITPVFRPQTLRVVTEGPFVTLLADDRKLRQVRIDREPAGSVGIFVDGPGLTTTFSDVSFGPRS